MRDRSLLSAPRFPLLEYALICTLIAVLGFAITDGLGMGPADALWAIGSSAVDLLKTIGTALANAT